MPEVEVDDLRYIQGQTDAGYSYSGLCQSSLSLQLWLGGHD